jgi:hypothetical protein
MDADSATAMWGESNVAHRSQRIILRCLKAFFGRWIIVPEVKIRELKYGALKPICDCTEVGNDMVHYWYKPLDEVVFHHIRTELKHRGQEFFKNNGHNTLDVILGCNHGARKFRAELRLLFWNSMDEEVKQYSISLHVGHIDCTKDTREVLQKTLVAPFNDSLRRLVESTYIICHSTKVANQFCNVVVLAKETPSDTCTDSVNWFKTRTFIAGYLSFFAIALGKENMSTAWCTWCNLSKV